LKKILIITPTPTHPPVAGNRAAVLALANELMDAGHEVHCLYIPSEDYNKEEMSAFFKGNFYSFEWEKLNKLKLKIEYYQKRIFQKLKGLKLFFMEMVGSSDAESYQYNRKIDGNLTAFIKKFTKSIARQHKFDIVICEYVWISGLLNYFPKSTFKIIDTHDRFSNRYLVYKKMNRTPEWDSLFPKEEAKGLKRADLIIALNEEEKDYFEKISGKKTVIRLPISMNKPLAVKTFSHKLLYFASDNIINQTSIVKFLEEVFPLVLKEVPSVQLLVGGRICNKLTNVPPNVLLKGLFTDPSDFYDLGDIIINPEIGGTGFKIKTFEGLSYGMPVVCTIGGAAGVADGVNEHLMIVNNSEEFADSIIKLCKDDTMRNELSLRAYAWAKKMSDKNTTEFLSSLQLDMKER
jgi:glycosyltransferase involved in cell wall biosynthesis